MKAAGLTAVQQATETEDGRALNANQKIIDRQSNTKKTLDKGELSTVGFVGRLAALDISNCRVHALITMPNNL